MNKLVTLEQLLDIRSQLKADGQKLVFTNGCFDIIHPGHIGYLREARDLGDRLVIAINSDSSVQRLKGPLRPILSETERACILAALEMVDYVVIFEEDTPHSIISAVLPDVLVKGGDWALDQIVGRAEVEAAGGIVRPLPYLDGASTTDIITRVLNRFQKN